MKHYDPIFNILYVICVCLTLTAIARPFLTQRAIPAIASSHFHPSGLPVASIDPVSSGLAPADIRRTALTFDDGPHPVYTDQFKNELIQTNEILYEITGEEIQYVRPPYGSWDKQLETDLNMFPVLWNVDPLDWRTANANRVAKAVISKVSENDIILMHDYYDTSVEAALMIVDELMLQGYEFVTVDKILFD